MFSNVLFVGLGGAGQRHLRILRQLLPEGANLGAYRRTGRTPFLREDFTVDAQRSLEDAYHLTMFDDLEAAFASHPDLTVISTPTSLHREPMMMALDAGSGILVEKPWAESLEGFAEFQQGIMAKRLPFHISFQRRFHPLIARARDAMVSGAIGRPMAAEFTVYSHVPSWHSYEDWRQLYAVRPELGGGVLLTEIHEIDLANWYFGLPDAVYCTGGSRGATRLEVEDTVQMTLLYEEFSVQITLCFMHSKPSRRFHIAGTQGDLRWGGDENQLRINTFEDDREECVDLQPSNDDMFMAQAQRFLSGWSMEDTRESLWAAGASLAVVDAARRSMTSGRNESVQRLEL